MTSQTEHVTQQHFLDLESTTPEALEELLDLAVRMRRKPRRYVKLLRGESVACYFEKPSTRTRVSFEVAAHRLGALPIMLRPDELQLGRGEPISDTAKVLSSYCCAIVGRVFDQATLLEMARHATVPVVNALSGDHHPCQALADLLTMRDHFGQLAGLSVAYVGDTTNVANSLMQACALAGVKITLSAPLRYTGDPEIVRQADRVASTNGTEVRQVESAEEAVSGADVVYTDSWVSMGREDEQAQRVRAFEPFRVTRELMALAQPEAVFMHCLPAHRGEEVTAEVIDGPQSIVFAQAANRLPTEQAVLWALVAHRHEDDSEDEDR